MAKHCSKSKLSSSPDLGYCFLIFSRHLSHYFFQSAPKKLPQLIADVSPEPVASVNPTSSDNKYSPVLVPSPAGTPAATTPTEKGADLHEIKYKLPEGWKATYKTDAQGQQGLMITPPSGEVSFT